MAGGEERQMPITMEANSLVVRELGKIQGAGHFEVRPTYSLSRERKEDGVITVRHGGQELAQEAVRLDDTPEAACGRLVEKVKAKLAQAGTPSVDPEASDDDVAADGRDPRN